MVKSRLWREIEEQSPELADFKRFAKEHGVAGDFFLHDEDNPDNPDSGVYFVCCPDSEPMSLLYKYPSSLLKIINYNKTLGNSGINLHYNTVHAHDITEENYFSFHNSICQAITDISIAKNGFYEFGYPLPKKINRDVIDAMLEFDKNRRNPDIPLPLAERFNKGFRKYVSEIHHLYEKADKKNATKKINHKVPKDYFVKNCIQTTYDVVSEQFYEYILEHLHEYPDFIYYKSRRPCLHLKDLSKSNKNVYGLWDNDTEYTEYTIGFPSSQEDIFYKLLIEYNCRNYKCCIPKEDLIQTTDSPLRTFEVRRDDMYSFNYFCIKKKINFCVDFDKYSSIDASDTERIIVGTRIEDTEKVEEVVASVAQNRKNFFPVKSPQKKSAATNRPMYQNPFLSDPILDSVKEKRHSHR